ncbi:Pre-pilin leader sequence protein [Salinisphaera shabanensis E1L3A]|uniref:Pre-pilin leader sequence protein n=1 Tax=Salinisphaera shabanensis E1L3A TaxID=1033802 RepID=U2EIK2_9GAMM|nr:type IV pilus modification protein PilV [Salinisphaera shabanensis]ERJ17890.1 Pre-pilin leader sequence protein [Salinisphaera shabanensis E1L3A]
MRQRNKSHRAADQTGFTLLEALVTLVIVSIGLLGILGLQTVSIANTQSSSARSIATVAADNLADRMRVNFIGARDGEYDDIDHPASGGGSGPQPCTVASTCNPARLAQRDAWEWDAALDPALPNGEGHVSCEERVDGDCITYRISILWSERDPDRAAGVSDPDMSQCDNNDPMVSGCFQTVVRP